MMTMMMIQLGSFNSIVETATNGIRTGKPGSNSLAVCFYSSKLVHINSIIFHGPLGGWMVDWNPCDCGLNFYQSPLDEDDEIGN